MAKRLICSNFGICNSVVRRDSLLRSRSGLSKGQVNGQRQSPHAILSPESARANAQVQPLTAPKVIPRIKYFCANKAKMIIGTIITTLMAAIGPH